MMDIPVLGVIENYSWLSCPDCGRKIEVFGKSSAGVIAKDHDIPKYATLPLDPALSTTVIGLDTVM